MPLTTPHLTIGSHARLTVDAQKRQPELGHARGTVLDHGGGAVKVRWLHGESWHKAGDLELVTKGEVT